MLIVTVIFLPLSYYMNKNIYHHPALRFLVGVVTVMFAPIAFVIMLFQHATHYFGLLPLMEEPKTGNDKEAGFIMPLFYKIVTAVLHPFVAFHDDPTDSTGFKKTFEHLLAKNGEKTVDEGLEKAAAEAGAEIDKTKWRAKMAELQPKFQTYLGISDVAAPALLSEPEPKSVDAAAPSSASVAKAPAPSSASATNAPEPPSPTKVPETTPASSTP